MLFPPLFSSCHYNFEKKIEYPETLQLKGLPILNVSVNTSIAAWDEGGGVDQFPSIRMYVNTSGKATVDADSRFGYKLNLVDLGKMNWKKFDRIFHA